jgi:hypothetical protein
MNLNRSVTRWLAVTLLTAAFAATFPATSSAQIGIGISVRVGPPALPIYAQPICPGPGYLWTPGYWGWNNAGGYYWVPGTWVVAPIGMLWTPGYWGFAGGFYGWHGGYWGPHIGFYGGINYGYGYGGIGFVGGEWRGGGFYYNRSVTNVSVTNTTNVYNKTVIVNNTTTTSFNGEGGVKAEPTPQEQAAEHEQHTAPLAAQTQHETLASQNHENFASENHGRPAIAATAKAGDFSSHSVVPARSAGGEYHAPAMSPQEARGPSNPGYHPFTPANSNNANHTTGSTSPTPQDKPANNGGFRPFTPPNSTNSQNANTQNKGTTTNPAYHENGNAGTMPTNQNKAATPPPANPPHNNNNSYKPAPQHKSPPPPHNQNKPPKEEHNKGKGR